MAFRARVQGWNLPPAGDLPDDEDPDPPESASTTLRAARRFNLEVANADGLGGEEFFEFEVHSPETLHRLLQARGALFGRGVVVVVGDYDPERVTEALRPLVESVEGETWEEVAFRVSSLGPWEFEGWRWYPDEERLRPHPGVAAEVRNVRLLRTAIGDSFSLPIEVGFGVNGVERELTVSLLLQSPLWIRNHIPPGGIVVGSGRIFSLRPDADEIRTALVEISPVARAPSWDLLGLALRPLRPGT
jgi:hypothetical protein